MPSSSCGGVAEEMDRRPQLLDWYWRLVKRWALAGLWLSRGELDHAREEGKLLLEDAYSTAERTWQALACEVNARIALAGHDPREARDLIERGLAAMEGVEAPVAAWQVHATAAEVCTATGRDGPGAIPSRVEPGHCPPTGGVTG